MSVNSEYDWTCNSEFYANHCPFSILSTNKFSILLFSSFFFIPSKMSSDALEAVQSYSHQGEDSSSSLTQSEPQINAVQDLIAGGIAGSASVVVGHPFDTYKVLLQTSSSSANTPNTSFSKSSILKLYKGMGAPLTSAMVVNALIFSSYGESSRLWDDLFYADEGVHHLQKDVPNVSFIANCWEKNMN